MTHSSNQNMKSSPTEHIQTEVATKDPYFLTDHIWEQWDTLIDFGCRLVNSPKNGWRNGPDTLVFLVPLDSRSPTCSIAAYTQAIVNMRCDRIEIRASGVLGYPHIVLMWWD